MAYDDKKLGTIFPRRTGQAQGSATERQMLDAIADTTGFRTGFRMRPDGGYTMVRTKGGQPQFSSLTPGIVPTQRLDIYLETGRLQWNFPAELAPDRLDPATWHFIDIPTTGPWLGRIRLTSGAQANDTPLVEGQDSLAIGYPHSAFSNIEADNRAAYAGATVMKKLTAGWFPPSLFTGKMRLLMQSLYGAKETTTPGPLKVEFDGNTAILKYYRGNDFLTLGTSVDNSPGVFCDELGGFWLAVITNPTGAEYVVTVYPITPQASVAALVAYYKAHLATLDPDLKTKLEAYIFAASVIEVDRPKVAGTFVAPHYLPLAYGWKWNSDGSKASIVVHKTEGDAGTDTLCFRAYTLHVTLASQVSRGVRTFSASASTTDEGLWRDGWGTYNIFVPSTETGMDLFSIATSNHALASLYFEDIPVYGYYVDDTWTPVRLSRPVPPPKLVVYVHSYTGNLVWASDFTFPEDAYWDQSAATPWKGTCTYERRKRTIGSGSMDVKFAGYFCLGVTYSEEVYSYSQTFSEQLKPSTVTDDTQPGSFPDFEIRQSGLTFIPVPDPPGYGNGGSRQEWVNADGTADFSTRPETSYVHWALVVPRWDAEALYVATDTADGLHSAYTNTHKGAEAQAGSHGWAVNYIEEISPGNWITHYKLANDSWSWHVMNCPFSGGYSTQTIPANTQTTLAVKAFTRPAFATNGKPGGSLASLFNVDRNYAHYDRNMTLDASIGGRYSGSDVDPSPAGLPEVPLFVGWA